MATKKSVSSLKESDLKGMRVFARIDLNEPLDDSFKITDDTCIRVVVPTIKSQQGQRLFSVDDFQWDYVWFTLRWMVVYGSWI
ncbi:phosphoglycerate kinase, cytosolic [Tanacetum coccineum]